MRLIGLATVSSMRCRRTRTPSSMIILGGDNSDRAPTCSRWKAIRELRVLVGLPQARYVDPPLGPRRANRLDLTLHAPTNKGGEPLCEGSEYSRLPS